jgi:hypothetical protein
MTLPMLYWAMKNKARARNSVSRSGTGVGPPYLPAPTGAGFQHVHAEKVAELATKIPLVYIQTST